jgi:hypothetical protein
LRRLQRETPKGSRTEVCQHRKVILANVARRRQTGAKLRGRKLGNAAGLAGHGTRTNASAATASRPSRFPDTVGPCLRSAVAQDDPPAPTTSFFEWKDRAEVQLERGHGVKATTIPASVWTRLYIQGRSPKEAAEQAAVSAYNTRPAFQRMRGKNP